MRLPTQALDNKEIEVRFDDGCLFLMQLGLKLFQATFRAISLMKLKKTTSNC